MENKLKIVITATGALALAGAGIAAGATGVHGKLKKNATRTGVVHAGNGPGHPGGSFGGHFGGPGGELDAAAAYIGVTSDALLTDLRSGKTLAQIASSTTGKSTAGLVAALVADETTKIDAAVTAGKLTQAKATTEIAGLTARFTAFVAGSFPEPRGRGGFGGPGGPGHGPSDDLTAAATYLGVTSAALAADLKSGETLAQVAGATSGKTVAGLVAALVAHETTEIDAAVTAGKLTRAQADARIADLTQDLTRLVNGTAPARGSRGGHRPNA
jgi:hypothetical protein